VVLDCVGRFMSRRFRAILNVTRQAKSRARGSWPRTNRSPCIRGTVQPGHEDSWSEVSIPPNSRIPPSLEIAAVRYRSLDAKAQRSLLLRALPGGSSAECESRQHSVHGRSHVAPKHRGQRNDRAPGRKSTSTTHSAGALRPSRAVTTSCAGDGRRALRQLVAAAWTAHSANQTGGSEAGCQEDECTCSKSLVLGMMTSTSMGPLPKLPASSIITRRPYRPLVDIPQRQLPIMSLFKQTIFSNM